MKKSTLLHALSISITILALTLQLSNATANSPKGLANPLKAKTGNRCFINAALQSLYHLEGLTQLVESKKNSDYYKPTSIAHLYLTFIESQQASNQAILNPEELCKEGWKIIYGQPGEQHDSAEFTLALLNHLADYDILDSVYNKLLENKNNLYSDQKTLKTSLTRSFSLITASLITKDTPSKQHLSTKIERLSALELALPDKPTSLNKLVASYFSPEQLVGENRYFSEKTKSSINAIKTLYLKETGRYLIIALKRNQFNKNTNSIQKNQNPVSFLLDNLDISPYFMPEDQEQAKKYHLQSFIVHSGKAEGGHYTAYVKKNKQWYFCNDDQVTPVTLEAIEQIARQGYGTEPQQTPVVFFYELKHV